LLESHLQPKLKTFKAELETEKNIYKSLHCLCTACLSHDQILVFHGFKPFYISVCVSRHNRVSAETSSTFFTFNSISLLHINLYSFDFSFELNIRSVCLCLYESFLFVGFVLFFFISSFFFFMDWE
jgi:hypothetical protein